MDKEDTLFNITIKNKVAILFYIKLFFYFINIQFKPYIP